MSETEITEPLPIDTGFHSGFVPDTEEKVNWVLRKYADAVTCADRIMSNAEIMANVERRRAEAILWQFKPSLIDYLNKAIAGGKRRSVTLFHGVLGWRKKAASLIFDETEAYIWVLKNAPDLLKIDKVALSGALSITDEGNVIFKDTGETVTFAQIKPAEDNFYVK